MPCRPATHKGEVVEGRRFTCVRSFSKDVKNAGGSYVDEPMAVDGNFVTSHPPEFPSGSQPSSSS